MGYSYIVNIGVAVPDNPTKFIGGKRVVGSSSRSRSRCVSKRFSIDSLPPIDLYLLSFRLLLSPSVEFPRRESRLGEASPSTLKFPDEKIESEGVAIRCATKDYDERSLHLRDLRVLNLSSSNS